MANWKYYMKIKTGTKSFRYFYSKAEYDAYLANQRPKKAEPEQKKSSLADLINAGKNAFSSIQSSIRNTAQNVTKNVNNTINNTKKNISKISNNATKQISNFMNSTLDSANKKIQSVIDSGKQTVQRTFKYFAKIGEGKNTRYFYTKAEYDAFMSKGQKFVQELNGGVNDALSSAAKIAGTLLAGVPATLAKNLLLNGKSVAGTLLDKIISVHDRDNIPSTPSTPTPSNPIPAKPVSNPTPASPGKPKGSKVDKSQLPLNFDKQDYLMDHDDNMKSVNPNFNPKWDDPNYEFHSQEEFDEYLDYSNNCIACTVTFDLRERGYDVNAMPVSYYTQDAFKTMSGEARYGPHSETILKVLYNNAEEVKINGRDLDVSYNMKGNIACDFQPPCLKMSERKAYMEQLKKELQKQGSGARGHVTVSWADESGYSMSGHSVAYTVEGNTVYIRDTQHNMKYTMDEFIDIYGSYIGNAGAVRLDRAEPTEEVDKWVHSASSNKDYRVRRN